MAQVVESLVELTVHRLAYKEVAAFFMPGRLLTKASKPILVKRPGKMSWDFFSGEATENCTAPVTAEP